MTFMSQRRSLTGRQVPHTPQVLMQMIDELERKTRELDVDWRTFDLNTSPGSGDVFLIRMSVEVDT